MTDLPRPPQKVTGYRCVIRGEQIKVDSEHASSLDPCGLFTVSNVDKAREHQREQMFACYLECFRHITDNKHYLYLERMSSPAEIEEEERSN